MARRALVDFGLNKHYNPLRFMNPKTTSQLKKELLTKKEVLMGLHMQNTKASRDDETLLTDIADRSDVEEAWFTKERMSQHWKSELTHIDTALKRMEMGSFGICEECDDEIPLKRLRVRPDASLCLDCQELMEKEMGSVRAVGPISTTTIH
jgi:DnaK suppressor protein